MESKNDDVFPKYGFAVVIRDKDLKIVFPFIKQGEGTHIRRKVGTFQKIYFITAFDTYLTNSAQMICITQQSQNISSESLLIRKSGNVIWYLPSIQDTNILHLWFITNNNMYLSKYFYLASGPRI